MSIQDRRIEEWRNPIAAEADRPNRSAADMKAIFDSNTNELKDALNGLIDDLMAGSATVSFEPASVRENISAADTLAVILGKLAKFFADAQTALNVVKIDGENPNRFLCADGEYKVPSAGEAVNGMPSGGTEGMHLVKASGLDFDARWVDMKPGDIGAAVKSVDVSVTLSGWAASGDGFSKTATVTGVTPTSNVIVSPSASSFSAWADGVVRATALGTDSVTFFAESDPGTVTANILIVG